MTGVYTIYTGVLEFSVYKECFQEIISILKSNGMDEVDLYFGAFWGNVYRNFIPFNIRIDNIQHEIDKAEKSGAGFFGGEDLFISLNPLDIEILFNHERCIYLDYFDENNLVSDILRLFESKHITSSIKKNEFPRLNSWRPPDMLNNEKFIARLVSRGSWTNSDGKVKAVQIFALNYDFNYEYQTMYNYPGQKPNLNPQGEQYVLWWNERPFFTQRNKDGIEFPGIGGFSPQEAKEAGMKSAKQEIIWDDL
jgi:hypothetical protein